ncbi:MAG TPA: pentapeptide repeat-containing protein [Candidatus Obscuribacterales bacterium]
MKALQGFWQFLNTDVKAIPWGNVAEQGIEAIKTLPDTAEAWQDNAAKIQQLAPYAQKAEPLLKALDDPMIQLAMAGLPFVSIGTNLLKLGLAMAKVDPTFESSVAIVAQLAYLQSLETVLGRLQDEDTKAKLAQLSFKAVIERQLTRLDKTELATAQAKLITTKFRESELAQKFGAALTEQLQQVGLEDNSAQQLVDQVLWGSHRYFHQAIAEAGESVEPLAEFYRTGGRQAQERYDSIDDYLKTKIEPLPLEQVFDESNPKVRFKDIYVRLEVQPLTQDGDVDWKVRPLCSHAWTRQILEQPADKPRKVMFIEGDAGRGKSVFCRMIADWVRTEFGDAFIPLHIRLREIRTLANNLTETLEDCPDLEQVQFVRGESDWLADKNTRFLIILDGFDELLLEGRATGGLKEFLQQVTGFQKNSNHQLLVTGRPLALQGIDRLITQNKDLERVRLEPMGNQVREQWLTNWKAIFGDDAVNTLQQFLTACPKDITNTLAREPLLLYLLARLNREGHLTQDMFAKTQTGSNQEIQAKLRIYRESVNWVLEQQRQDENLRLSGLDNLDDLREVLQEAALCVVQAGNETARLEMVKQRFQDSSNPMGELLKQAQETTGQSEDKALNNLLTTFYLKPGEGDKQGSVEFAHKSFGEYLFAERLIVAFEAWTEVDKRSRYRLDDRALNEQIYDVFGYGGLSQEIVAYLFELLEESDIDQVRLFKRLHTFYQHWCQNDFLDAPPNENLPQKKLLQLRKQEIPTGLRQVDVFTVLNVMIVLFKLHAAAQLDDYPDLPKDTPRPNIWFHPCGDPETEDFESDQLLNIIHYADALGLATFAKTVGPHLDSANLYKANLYSANLDSANLYKANLYSANLYSANLDSANLYKANLSSANFSSANLYSAHLYKANLDKANLDKASLDSANLDKANLDSANLDSANLSGANLSSANLSSANLYEANLDSANLYSANLDSANLDSANLYEANLYRANLYRANLYSANLYSANLSSANLSSANLYEANLDSANLDSANLDRANLYRANLYRANLNSALLIETKLSTTQNLTLEQMEGEHPPLLCNAALPNHLTLDPNRDWDRLAGVMFHEEYFETLEAAAQWVEERRPH